MSSSLQPGSVVAGRYRVERLLGRGGMGVVFEATQLGLERRVAIKVLGVPDASREHYARFEQEARAVAKLRGQHVVQVLDFGRSDDGHPFIAMELLSGRDLREELDQRRWLPVTESVDLVLQACVAMAEAHSVGIVHRDLKPANLWLATEPDASVRLKVLDFGISKLQSSAITTTDTMLGSPAYMAPEQVYAKKDLDGRVDVWALGVILYEMMTGVALFAAESAPATFVRIATEPTPPLGFEGVPAELSAIVAACLEKNPQQRIASVGALALDLSSFASDRGRHFAHGAARIAGLHGAAMADAAPTGRQDVDVPTAPSPSEPTVSLQPVHSSEPTRREAGHFGTPGARSELESQPTVPASVAQQLAASTGSTVRSATPSVGVPVDTPRPESPTRSRIALGVLAVVAVVGAAAVGVVAGQRAPDATSGTDAGSASPSADVDGSEPALAASAGAASVAATPDASATPPPSASAPTSSVPAPRAPAPPPAPISRRPAPAARPAPAPASPPTPVPAPADPDRFLDHR